jgi:uncharacterized RDD family membrane protein YckC
LNAAEAAPAAGPTSPGLRRRLAALLYEGVLLFGVVWAVGIVYGVATNQRHALHGALGLKITLFAVLGLYFVYFWSRHGQTLAMRTWRLRVVGPSSAARAMAPPPAYTALPRCALASTAARARPPRQRAASAGAAGSWSTAAAGSV